MPRRDTDPVGNFNFNLEVSGLESASFAEISGFSLETEVIEYRTGNQVQNSVVKLPGVTRAGDLTLKRGITGSNALFEWYKTVMRGQIERRNASLILLDDSRSEVMRWNFFEAWPRKYVGPMLSARGNDVAIEELVLVSEFIELA